MQMQSADVHIGQKVSPFLKGAGCELSFLKPQYWQTHHIF
jgi:hypothetical protein